MTSRVPRPAPRLRLCVREYRLPTGMSQEALAAKARVRQATISDMESGRVRRVDLDVVERIAAALGVSPFAILGQPDP